MTRLTKLSTLAFIGTILCATNQDGNVTVKADAPTCSIGVDIVHVQDTHDTFKSYYEDAAEDIYYLQRSMSDQYSVDSYASFVAYNNKALPGLGFGNGLGIENDYSKCYANVLPLSNNFDSSAVIEGLNKQTVERGARETTAFEALYGVATDATINFRSTSGTDDNSLYTRIAILVTDTLPGVNSNLYEYNIDNIWNDKSDTSPAGAWTETILNRTRGFGLLETWDKGYIYADPDGVNKQSYANYCTAFNECREAYLNNTDEDAKCTKTAIGLIGTENKLGPKTFADQIDVPSNSIVDYSKAVECIKYKNLAITEVVSKLKSNRIYPIVILHKPTSITDVDKNACANVDSDVVIDTSESYLTNCLKPFYLSFLTSYYDKNTTGDNIDASLFLLEHNSDNMETVYNLTYSLNQITATLNNCVLPEYEAFSRDSDDDYNTAKIVGIVLAVIAGIITIITIIVLLFDCRK